MTGLPLFDTAFYQAQAEGLPDVAADPLGHYREVGWRLLLDPHPLFSTAHYLRHAGDLGGMDPLDHYARQGAAARVPATQWFDPVAYVRNNPDVAAAGLDLLTHFIEHGAAEQRSAGPRMDRFLRRNPQYARPGGALDAARDDRSSHDAWMRTTRHVPPAVCEAVLRAIPEAAPGAVPGRPLVSVLLHATDEVGLESAIASLRMQAYPDWELCIAAPDAMPGLAALAAEEPRIRRVGNGVPFSEGDTGAALEAALVAAHGEWVWVMETGDRLHPLALATLAQSMPGHDALYADEDWMQADGDLPQAPVFRPAWSPELLLGDEALPRACLMRTGLLREAGGFRPRCGTATVFDLGLRALLDLPPGRVAHVPHALVHRTGLRCTGPQPDRGADAVRALERILPRAVVSPGSVVFEPDGEPCVGVVITGTNATIPGPLGPDWLVGVCLAGLRGGTDWRSLDIAVAVPGPLAPWQAQVIASMGARHVPGVNAAARAVQGEAVLLLDEAVTPRGPGWLQAMLGALQRPGVGVVGARLSFPDGRLCHAGLTVQDGLPARPFFAAPFSTVPGDVADSMPHTLRTCLAVSGACLLASRAAWDAVVGVDEAWPSGIADVDLCLRIGAEGLRTVYVPEAALFHAQPMPLPIPAQDAARFRERWGNRSDPFYPDALPSWTPFGALEINAALGTPSEAQPLPPGAAMQGVNWFGPVNRASGMGAASRGYLAACAAAGLRARVMPLDRVFGHQPAAVGPEPGPMQDFAATVMHANADTMGVLAICYPEVFQNARTRIGIWVWELPEALPEWAETARHFHELWTPSAFCAKAFRAITDVPVAVIPHVVPIRPRPARAPARAALHAAYGVPPEAFMVLYMLDTHSFVARKNPQALLDAFAAEFGSGPNVDMGAVLVLKVSSAAHLRQSPWPEDQALLRQMRNPPANVVFITETLDADAVALLLGTADCYVSPHRSEGFGLTVAEAMAVGTPVIATDWGATGEFVLPGVGLPIKYTLVPVEAGRDPYPAGSLWADVSVTDLRERLRLLANDRELRESMSAAGQALVRYRFSPAAVGALIRQRLEGLAART